MTDSKIPDGDVGPSDDEVIDAAIESWREEIEESAVVALEAKTDREVAMLAWGYARRVNADAEVVAVLHASALRLARAGWGPMDERESHAMMHKLFGEESCDHDPASKPS